MRRKQKKQKKQQKEIQKKVLKKQPTSGIKIYKRLIKYIYPYKKLLFLSFLGYFISSLTQPLFAEMIKHIIDTLQSGDKEDALGLPIMFSSLIIVRSLGVFVGAYFVSRMSAHVVHDLRCDIFKHYTRLPVAYFDSHNSGYLISRITNNVQQVTTASLGALRTIIREGMTAIGLLAYLFYINWQLSLVFLGIAPVIAIVVTVVSKRLRRLSKKIQESVGDLTQIASEVVGGNRVVKSYGGERYENKRFVKQSKYHREQKIKLSVTTALQNPVIQTIIAVALSGLMYFALLFMDKATTGEFVGYLTAAFMLPRAIKFISGANAKIQKGVAAAESLFEVLDEAIEKNEGKELIKTSRGEVEFINVSFSYGKKEQALKDISFKIVSGQTVALVGASGSGKTTLANLLMRFYDTSKGNILIDGRDINSIEIESLRSQIALVGQNVTLFEGSIKDNITYGAAEPNEARIISAAKEAYAMEFIEKYKDKMDAQIGEHGVKLSGGQRQRLAFARAMYKDAPILILDEATSALDTKSERYIQAALEKVQKNRTVLVIAHRLSTIESADVIFVMDSGRIVERGSHKELLKKNGKYSQLHDLQFKESSQKFK